MQVFHCDSCQQLVFFENVQCLKCGHKLAYLPDIGAVGSLEPAGESMWQSRSQATAYRLCRNYVSENVCNWAIAGSDSDPLCVSCRLTRVIPDLTRPGNKEAWYRLEVAKRRLLYTLFGLGLPVQSKTENSRQGLVFEFLSEVDAEPVLTGHRDGVITLNVAEADDVQREQRRHQLHEPYRTLLGHFRHEIGHYYWDQLVDGGDRLEQFRLLFGDERVDYLDALERHYQVGPTENWQQRYVSEYASAHPWEDWAESWAHYLHMVDTLETASASGLSLQPSHASEPAMDAGAARPDGGSFYRMADAWFPLTYVLNNLNRGMGLQDAYPFVLSAAAIDKLCFVHEIVRRLRPVGNTRTLE